MDFQRFETLIGNIMFFWVVCCAAVWLINRKKKKAVTEKVRKWILYISIIMLASYFLTNIVRNTISFTSLEKAISFYGKTNQQGHPLIGEETAFVPESDEGIIYVNIYEKRKDKWKLPQDFSLGGNRNAAGNSAMDKNTADYSAGITWDGNTDSCYIFLWDSTENGWKKRNVKDSENSNFIYFGSKLGKGLNVSIYYSYLKEVPSDYKLYIDDYEIEVDWRELLENR